jgi:integral membrane sensor domain MASE1
MLHAEEKLRKFFSHIWSTASIGALGIAPWILRMAVAYLHATRLSRVSVRALPGGADNGLSLYIGKT